MDVLLKERKQCKLHGTYFDLFQAYKMFLW